VFPEIDDGGGLLSTLVSKELDAGPMAILIKPEEQARTPVETLRAGLYRK
jgi:hypothetical protein